MDARVSLDWQLLACGTGHAAEQRKNPAKHQPVLENNVSISDCMQDGL